MPNWHVGSKIIVVEPQYNETFDEFYDRYRKYYDQVPREQIVSEWNQYHIKRTELWKEEHEKE